MTMPYTTNEKVGRVRIQAIRMLESGKTTREDKTSTKILSLSHPLYSD